MKIELGLFTIALTILVMSIVGVDFIPEWLVVSSRWFVIVSVVLTILVILFVIIMVVINALID